MQSVFVSDRITELTKKTNSNFFHVLVVFVKFIKKIGFNFCLLVKKSFLKVSFRYIDSRKLFILNISKNFKGTKRTTWLFLTIE